MTALDGRRAYTRADLMAAHGLGRSTLEKWYRERDANGHPDAAGTVGSQLVWDAEAWDRWYASRGAAPGVPPGLATRDELAARHGLSRHRLKQLWAGRAANGHPEVAHRSGKALYWDASEWDAWYAALEEDGDRDGDDGGDPDDLVTLAEVARILGLAQTSVTVYPRRPPAGWPEPAREEPLGGGRVRRLYRRRDILAYAARRRP
ncbi:hypothetical protein [Actinomadura xylanilytica]|uniref:hypothetical protein n=1 Tax=Actinomadura xylanilytica TaxID=887459 RepID=UPI00255B238D|nr:hypothetical protein [Actinomadura xylanilytica]MDL4775985.1 hypothetical protein [Actinomadura xylanilytica]